MVKAITSVKGGDPPQLSVILSTDMFSLIDEDAIIPFDEIVRSDADKAWLQSFYPALMANSQTGGKTWGVPPALSTLLIVSCRSRFTGIIFCGPLLLRIP
jgi:sn-glycerol 3-phosphate transport system substrate-binding protein